MSHVTRPCAFYTTMCHQNTIFQVESECLFKSLQALKKKKTRIFYLAVFSRMNVFE